MKKKPRSYSADFKREAVRRMAQATTIIGLAKELGIRRKLLYQWRDQLRAGGKAALDRRKGRPPGSKSQTVSPPLPDAAELRIAELERLLEKALTEKALTDEKALTGRCEKIDFAEISSEPKCMPKAQRSLIRNPDAIFLKAKLLHVSKSIFSHLPDGKFTVLFLLLPYRQSRNYSVNIPSVSAFRLSHHRGRSSGCH